MDTVSASDDDLEPQPEIDVYHQDGIHNYPDDRNATSGKATATAFEDTGDIDNHLSLSVNPRRVDSCEEETNVKISITGTGTSEMETIRYSDGTTVDYEPHTVEFYVQQSDVEADLDLRTSQNTGVNTDGDERRGTRDSTKAMAQITLGAASFLPVIGPAAGVGSLGLTLMDAMDDNNNALKEYTLGTNEPYGEMGATYYIEEDDDDLYDNEVIYFGFSTEVQWTIPSEHRDDIHELEIGASIENEEASSYGGGTAYEYEYGAETDPITVELKNADISEMRSQKGVLDGGETWGVDTAFMSDEIEVVLPRSGVYFTDNPPPEVPKLDITVDWAADIPDYNEITMEESWEPHGWIAHVIYVPYGKELSVSHRYDLDELGIDVGEDKDVEVEIT